MPSSGRSKFFAYLSIRITNSVQCNFYLMISFFSAHLSCFTVWSNTHTHTHTHTHRHTHTHTHTHTQTEISIRQWLSYQADQPIYPPCLNRTSSFLHKPLKKLPSLYNPQFTLWETGCLPHRTVLKTQRKITEILLNAVMVCKLMMSYL